MKTPIEKRFVALDGGEGWGEVISRYSRADAIADGVLVDVTPRAREAGIRYPVAMTSTVWNEYVEVPTGVVGQDQAGRLWDVLWMFAVAARRTDGDLLFFRLYVRNDNRRARMVELKAVCGPGDEGEPVITVMLPDED